LLTDVSEVRAASIIALMMEAAHTSETLVDDYFTRQYIPEDSELLNLHSFQRIAISHLVSKNREVVENM
jgi:hypothetical protein